MKKFVLEQHDDIHLNRIYFFRSYDWFTIQYPLPILHEWQGHHVRHLV